MKVILAWNHLSSNNVNTSSSVLCNAEDMALDEGVNEVGSGKFRAPICIFIEENISYKWVKWHDIS